MQSPEGLEDTPFKWKIFSNFVAFSEYPNFKRGDTQNSENRNIANFFLY